MCQGRVWADWLADLCPSFSPHVGRRKPRRPPHTSPSFVWTLTMLADGARGVRGCRLMSARLPPMAAPLLSASLAPLLPEQWCRCDVEASEPSSPRDMPAMKAGSCAACSACCGAFALAGCCDSSTAVSAPSVPRKQWYATAFCIHCEAPSGQAGRNMPRCGRRASRQQHGDYPLLPTMTSQLRLIRLADFGGWHPAACSWR